MTSLEILNQIQLMMDDYQEELWADAQFRDNMYYIIGRQISTGVDLSDEELVILDKFIKEKIEQIVKAKGN